MSEWNEYKIGTVVNVKHGYAFKGEYFSDSPTLDILLTPGNFNIGGGFKQGKLKYYKGEYPKQYILEEGDIIVTMTDLSKEGDSLGYSAKIPKHNDIRYLHNQRIGLLQFNSEDFCKDFIYWVLRSSDYHKFIVNSATGSTVKHTSPSRIGDYKFKAPALPTQSAIAEILSSLDDKIELNNKINQELETLAQTLFKQWFIDFEFPNENGEPYKSSGGEMVESELGEIPKGWEVKTIGDIGEIVCGKTPSKANKEFFGKEILFIKIPDMHNNVFINKTEDGLTLLGAESQKNKFLKKGTVILSSIATVGLVSIVSKDSQTNQQINAIVPTKDTYTNFLYLLLKSKTDDFKQLASGGSTTLNMNTSTFKGYRVLMPSQNKLDLFDSIVYDLFEKIYQQILEIEELENIRDYFLPKLISGELEINEIRNQ